MVPLRRPPRSRNLAHLRDDDSSGTCGPRRCDVTARPRRRWHITMTMSSFGLTRGPTSTNSDCGLALGRRVSTSQEVTVSRSISLARPWAIGCSRFRARLRGVRGLIQKGVSLSLSTRVGLLVCSLVLGTNGDQVDDGSGTAERDAQPSAPCCCRQWVVQSRSAQSALQWNPSLRLGQGSSRPPRSCCALHVRFLARD
jgi:hypothetical protein